jgi:hypothetical protein
MLTEADRVPAAVGLKVMSKVVDPAAAAISMVVQ